MLRCYLGSDSGHGKHRVGIFDKLLGRKKPPAEAPEHAVLVYFEYGSTDLSNLFAVEEALERVISEANVGELDGNEIATDGSDGTLFMYGPDADALFKSIRQTLEATPFMRGARVVLRYGPPEDDVPERTVTLPLS
jgi:hypothetical protein